MATKMANISCTMFADLVLRTSDHPLVDRGPTNFGPCWTQLPNEHLENVFGGPLPRTFEHLRPLDGIVGMILMICLPSPVTFDLDHGPPGALLGPRTAPLDRRRTSLDLSPSLVLVERN